MRKIIEILRGKWEERREGRMKRDAGIENYSRKKKTTALAKIAYLVFFMGIVGLFIYTQVGLTGRIGLEIKDSYVLGENISGVLKLGLKQGELLPVDSKLIIEQDGTIVEIALREIVESNAGGDFYIENQDIGGGRGWVWFYWRKNNFSNCIF